MDNQTPIQNQPPSQPTSITGAKDATPESPAAPPVANRSKIAAAASAVASTVSSVASMAASTVAAATKSKHSSTTDALKKDLTSFNTALAQYETFQPVYADAKTPPLNLEATQALLVKQLTPGHAMNAFMSHHQSGPREIAANYLSDAIRQNHVRKAVIAMGARYPSHPEISASVREMKTLVNTFESNHHDFDRFLSRKPFIPPYPEVK